MKTRPPKSVRPILEDTLKKIEIIMNTTNSSKVYFDKKFMALVVLQMRELAAENDFLSKEIVKDYIGDGL